MARSNWDMGRCNWDMGRSNWDMGRSKPMSGLIVKLYSDVQ